MLRTLLELVAQGNAHSQVELARKLGVSERLLVQMLEDLEWMGYLTPLDGSCAGQCIGCPLAKARAVGGSMRVWALMGKGLCSAKKRCRERKSSCTVP